jgi:predicted anti-sigma-YlaC factor YlaD
VEEQ